MRIKTILIISCEDSQLKFIAAVSLRICFELFNIKLIGVNGLTTSKSNAVIEKSISEPYFIALTEKKA